MKMVGAILLLLAVVGTLSSWSTMPQEGGGPYIVVNVLLAMVGLVLIMRGRRGTHPS